MKIYPDLLITLNKDPRHLIFYQKALFCFKIAYVVMLLDRLFETYLDRFI